MAAKSKTKKRRYAVRAIAVLIICALLALSLIWAEKIDVLLGLEKVKEQAYDGSSRGEVIESGSSTVGIGDNLNVHFIDVGQGDATVIELPDGKTVLIDAGPDSGKVGLLDYIDKNIFEADEENEAFDFAILTHSDEDHCGGMDEVLSKYPTRVFYRPNILCSYDKNGYIDPAANEIKAISKHKDHNTASYSRALTEAYNADKSYSIETQVHITDASNDAISVIAPSLPTTDPEYYSITFYAPTEKYFSDVNDFSPVIILEYHNNRIVLSGDAEKEAEKSFVKLAQKGEGKYAIFDQSYSVSAIKLGHHGSNTSNSLEFLETLTTPQSAPNVKIIVMSGLNNKYGHPHAEVIKRLNQLGFKSENILNTATNSHVGMAVKGSESNGITEYGLYVGADMVRAMSPTLQISALAITWNDIAITLMIATALALIVAPIIYDARKKVRRAAAKAKRKR